MMMNQNTQYWTPIDVCGRLIDMLQNVVVVTEDSISLCGDIIAGMVTMTMGDL